jgi:hypothetical protein
MGRKHDCFVSCWIEAWNQSRFVNFIISSLEELAMEETLKEALEVILEMKFGEPGLLFAKSLASVTELSLLKAILHGTPTAKSLDELRALIK